MMANDVLVQPAEHAFGSVFGSAASVEDIQGDKVVVGVLFDQQSNGVTADEAATPCTRGVAAARDHLRLSQTTIDCPPKVKNKE